MEDAKAGKPIVDGITMDQVKETKDLTVGILENGTTSGNISFMFCLKNSDGTVSMAQMTANQFEMLHGAYMGARARFGI